MCKMTVYQWLVLVLLLLKDVLALKDVVLTIEPEIVEKNHSATLTCSYNLEGATLYYVKWYRGLYEFYRFTPSEQPYTKVFPLTGVKVDMNHSNRTQVTLLDIDFNLSGKFSCEVTTTDEEPAKTETASHSMLVVQLPEYPPTIAVGREPLDYGDTLRANCSSSQARPPASLKFILNNMTVAWTDPLSPRKTQEALWSDLALELVLTEFHFNRGRLILRCVAQVAGVYHEEATLELDSARHPVPEKVSAVDSTSSILHQTILHVILFNFLVIVTS